MTEDTAKDPGKSSPQGDTILDKARDFIQETVGVEAPKPDNDKPRPGDDKTTGEPQPGNNKPLDEGLVETFPRDQKQVLTMSNEKATNNGGPTKAEAVSLLM